MGTTLTGTTPQDTYEALIKVGDNGIITGSLKTLSDGEGHDTALALSTGAASVTGTLAVSGNATFDTTTLVVDAANNRVGVGVASPTATLDVIESINVTAASNGFNIRLSKSAGFGALMSLKNTSASSNNLIRVLDSSNNILSTIDPATGGINFSAGNVGIGTSAPAVPLDVVGNIRSSTGILFGSDTAAANLLDDYEEGTWTIGVSFDGASVGVTTTANTGTYTKIGRQVTVNGRLHLSNKGISTGVALVTGLPFTTPNNVANNSSVSLLFLNISFANQFQGFALENSTQINLSEITEAGAITSLSDVEFANDSLIVLSLTYFV